MYTSQQIDEIMKELDLNPADATARNIVEQIANSKPQVAVDQNFISQLRSELQKRISATEEIKQQKSTNIFSMFMNKTLAAALVVAVVVIAGGAWYMQSSNTPLFNGATFGGSSDQLLSGKYDVKPVAEESFGDLNKVSIVSTADAAKLGNASAKSSTVPTSTSATSGMGGGYAGISMAGSAEGSAEAMPADKMIAPGEPYPGAMYYTFKYEGASNLPGLQAEQPVMKKVKPAQPSSIVDRIVNMLSFGLIDLSTLRDIKLQSFSFVEDREYGYQVNVDMQYGMVNIYQNYEKWPQANYDCVTVACQTPPAQLTLKDLPSNEDAIAAADNFLAEYKISKEGYGTPRVVDSYWRVAYDAAPAAERANYYIPEQVQVVYPLTLEGKEVYDEGGTTYGLNVMVDARTKRIMSVNELTSKQFEQSNYKGETDSKRIIDIAEQGGFRNAIYIDPGAKKVELKLGAPTVQMVKIYYSSDNYRTSSDLYMPALVFPIKNWKENNYWRQNVIVPLVKGILDTEQPQPQPMPVDWTTANTQGPAIPNDPNASTRSN